MSERDDLLIAEFNVRRSEEAFAALVRQHVHLVFATALRQVGDAGAAEEITQNVFVALAQAAGKLGSHPTIAGWLHQTALNKSREWLRSELRRRKREQVAVNLATARAEGDSVWSPLVPLLDEALLKLREPDRQAVILHFMEGRTFQEVGSVLGIGEDAARKRVHRCLDELTQFFRRRGFVVPALAAGAPLLTLSSHTAPAGLAASATTAGLAAAHSAASTSTLTLIKRALKIMAWTKVKTAIVVGVSVLLAAGTATTVVKTLTASPIDRYLSEPELQLYREAPPFLVIQPTHFLNSHLPSGAGAYGDKHYGRNTPVQFLIADAYDFPPTRMVFPKIESAETYDWLVTVTNQPLEQLQSLIKKQLGWVGRREFRDMDVFLLRVKQPGGLKMKIGTGPRSSTSGPDLFYDVAFQPMRTVAGFVENMFNKPVIDQTGLTNFYDFTLKGTWQTNYQANLDFLSSAIPDQLGLELVPTNMPIEMLVVEKAK